MIHSVWQGCDLLACNDAPVPEMGTKLSTNDTTASTECAARRESRMFVKDAIEIMYKRSWSNAFHVYQVAST